LQKEEDKLQRILAGKDSVAAVRVFQQSKERYADLHGKLKQQAILQQYIPSLDTLSSSLKFLQENKQYLRMMKDGEGRLTDAILKVNALQSKFQQTEDIKQFIRERKQHLREQFDQLGLAGSLKQFNKQAYYYSAQVSEFKQLLKDHRKAEKKALELLSKTRLFSEFMQKNSMLASLFRFPGDPNDPTFQSNLTGLQTRAQIGALVQQQIAAGGPNAQAQINQNMQYAQSQLNALKGKLTNIGGESDNDLEMPDGFKPNSQRTKSFLQRIEVGANIQSQKANGFFPVTSDLVLTAGYKISDNNTVGLGAGYKLGLGKNIRQIKVTHEGISLRSFVDMRIKGSFWLTGGYEMNYREAFHRFRELNGRSAWQESGLIGISKVINMRSKLFKKTKVQLVWDFLSYQTMTSPTILFRIGYSF
jgi:hypothetical protein